jgi:flagellar biosynthetic protein FlhB
MASEAGEKTEKPTDKKRADARKKGQVARSIDVNGSFVLLAGIAALAATAPATYARLEGSMRHAFTLIGDPSIVGRAGIGTLFSELAKTVGLAVLPVAATAMITGFLVSVAQVKWKPSAESIKPDPKKLNPISGAKNLFGKRLIFETFKNLLKVAVVAAVVIHALLPKVTEVSALMGMPPAVLLATLVSEILSLALWAGAAYVVIGAIDYGYQFYSTEKQLKMTKEEVKQEFKNMEQSAELKGAIKRRQMGAARARMMADVPDADVIVTNPTHYSVALKYSADKSAPVVVAKGKDIIAFRIREIAAASGVPIVPDPPLARSLHASVEVGHMIPEELFQAVASLLAYVYRTAGQRRRAAATSSPLAA